MYVSDGYGNKRIAKFDAQGNFLLQWGSEGTEPGQFALPHAINSDKEGLVYVSDRENWRVQIFSSQLESGFWERRACGILGSILYLWPRAYLVPMWTSRRTLKCS